MSLNDKKGKCVIFSAPSGAGKTSIVQHLLKQDLGLEFSISACSRSPRENEVDGKDYYFLSVEAFKAKIQKGDFLEWEEVYTDNFYGTLKAEIERIWAKNKCVVFDVDVVGGINLKKLLGEKALAIFVQAPSIAELEKRLRGRSTETEEKIQMRLAKAAEEMKKASEFDWILWNEDFVEACAVVEKKIRAFIQD